MQLLQKTGSEIIGWPLGVYSLPSEKSWIYKCMSCTFSSITASVSTLNPIFLIFSTRKSRRKAEGIKRHAGQGCVLSWNRPTDRLVHLRHSRHRWSQKGTSTNKQCLVKSTISFIMYAWKLLQEVVKKDQADYRHLALC